MKNRLRILCGIFFLIALFISPTETTKAATFQLSGVVSTQTGDPLSDVLVEVGEISSGIIVASTITASDGTYSLTLSEGPYDIKLIPPSESGYGVATAYNKLIDQNLVLDFILIPADFAKFSARIKDINGNGIYFQEVILVSTDSGLWIDGRTDEYGNISFDVIPGEYRISVDGFRGEQSFLPYRFTLGLKNPLYIAGNITMDITILVKRLDIHVNNLEGNPVSDVFIYTNTPFPTNSNSNFFGGLPGSGVSDCQTRTDSAGNATCWLIPTEAEEFYKFVASPPEGIGLVDTEFQTSLIEDTSTSITLNKPIIFSGKVTDTHGNPMVGNSILLDPIDNNPIHPQSITDDFGNFSVEAIPGNYKIYLSQTGFPNFSLKTNNFLLDEDTNVNFTIPLSNVQIHVEDSSGNPIADVTVQNGYPIPANTSIDLGLFQAEGRSNCGRVQTDINGNANCLLLPTQLGNTYTFVASPQEGSGFALTYLSGVSINEDTSLTITLKNAIQLSGKVLDPLGNGLPNQIIRLLPIDGGPISYTNSDSSGNYSIQVASGEYYLEVKCPSCSNFNASKQYKIITNSSISLTENTLMDLTIPFKRLDIVMQDPFGNPIDGIVAHAKMLGFENILWNNLHASGYSEDQSKSGENGISTLWLFPTTDNLPYEIDIYPPAGSPYAVLSLNVLLATDKSISILLQFIHPPPISSISLTPEPNSLGNYPDPVTVTLSANPHDGYQLDSINYRVDGGELYYYNNPFIVSGDGTHTIEYWSVDNAGVIETPKIFPFEIKSNQPPQIDANGPYLGFEGDPIPLSGYGYDPDGDFLSYTWSYESYSGTDPGAMCAFENPNILNPQITCTDDGEYTLTLTVDDGVNPSVSDYTTLTVENVNPEIVLIIAPIDPVQVNTLINFGADFIDDGTNDTHIALWDWGDGYQCDTNTDPDCSLNQGLGSGSVSGSHTYSEPGVYTILLTITDDDLGSDDELYQYVVIFSPTGGFVTGAGLIDSPAGAFIGDPTLIGKAIFGFVSRYQKGAIEPTGNTRFMFKVGNLTFESTSYDWLVVAGSKAQYKGIGKIKGWEGEYKFILTAIDADINENDPFEVDRFRIKIWRDDTSGEDVVIYDNGLGADIGEELASTEINAGSIAIHN